MTMNDRSRRGARASRVSRVSWTGQTLRDWSIVPLRAIVGYGFIAHGLAKWHRGPEAFAQLLSLIGVPFPIATAWLVTLLETLGGLAILLGVFVAIASGPLIASMFGRNVLAASALRLQLREDDRTERHRPDLRSAGLRDQPSIYRRIGSARPLWSRTIIDCGVSGAIP
jgi:uncharacterized membrane protein YphA (DoxX/SURF4 family)